MLITGCEKPLNKPWNSWFSESVVILHHTCVMWLVLGCVLSMIPMLLWHLQEGNHSRLHFQKKNKLGSSSFAERNCLRCACSRNNRIYRGSIFLGPEWSGCEQCWSMRNFVLSVQTFMIGKEPLIRNFAQSNTLRKCLTDNWLWAHVNKFLVTTIFV